MSNVTNMLNAIKADLTSRRMLPLLALLGVVLFGAVGYAVLGGSSEPSQVAVAPAHAPLTVPGPSVSKAEPNANEAVSETTSGTPSGHSSSSRDPFKPLPESAEEKKTNAATAPNAGASESKPSTGSSSSASSSTPSSSSPPAEKTPAPVKPKPKPKPKAPVYVTSVLFGQAPVPPANVPLTSYASVKRLQPLPSPQDPRIAFMGVSATGKGAIFSLVSEAILHGSAHCLPSTSQCEAIDLAVGKSEQLEYVEADGELVVYELQVQSITKSEQASTAAHKSNVAVSAAGKRLVGEGQILGLVHMRYSVTKGVLVLLEGHHAFGAKANAARHRHR